MKWNTKFNYPKSSRSNEDGMRKYLSGDEKYPSVTSILSLTKSEEDKASLELWKQRVGYKEANRIKTDASRRGTSLHSYIEDYLRGRVNDSFFESNEQHKNMAKVIIENGIKGKLDEIFGMEATLINPNDRYAGTADLIGIYYVQLPPDSGNLVIMRNDGSQYCDLYENRADMLEYIIEPEAGRLYVLPGHLWHYVTGSDSVRDRVSVSFNIFT